MEQSFRQSLGYMFFASILAAVLGVIMLAYPGGTVAMMAAAFWILKVIISAFILSSTIPEAVKMFKADRKGAAIGYLLLGIVATAVVLIFDVRIVFLIVAFFFIFAGMSDIVSAFTFPGARYFLALLGLLNIMIGAMMLKYPMTLPMLFAWYVLFWGVSRFFLALELRRTLSQ